MAEEAGLVAKVIVDAPGLGELDYAVPSDMLVALGDRVIVGLRTRNAVGIVTAIHSASDYEGRLRKIKSVLRDTAPLPSEWLALTRFAAQYYVRGWGEAAVPALPIFFRRLPGVRHELQLEKIRNVSGTDAVASTVPELNEEQQAAVAAVTQSEGFSPFLLFGVTGSGKTEVYLRIMEKTLSSDPEAQVMLLVPEINLTPQLEKRVRERFPKEKVVCLNSEFSDTDRARSWLAVHEGRARILVGTRMAVFASFRKLALLIVDEEHDGSFKAGDGLRFSARDLCIWRASKNHIPVVLGSATPSVETWVKAQSGAYTLLKLKARAVHNAVLPEVRMTGLPLRGSGRSLTDETAEAMQRMLDSGRQVLVFINRRGYSPVLSCPSCGWVSTCRRCSTFAVFHKGERALVCHHCGWRRSVPEACPACGNVDIIPRGSGTERIEEELSVRFPRRRIMRIDRDSVSKKHEAEHAFGRVHRGEVDILVGTQMIAKGHDFANVGMVVILNADAQILSPDARAKEHLFSTLMQVAGRAGRHGARGEVIIQTRMPGEPLFHFLEKQDYEGFADVLVEERRSNWCVPFVYQALVTAQAKTLAEALYFLNAVSQQGFAMAPEDVRIFDPVPMSVVRLMDVERAQLLIEADSRQSLNRFLWQWKATFRAPSNITWTIEVDPMSI
ncbi:MAG: primosomal protein N' [Sutterella sp.]|nr:primosomal protein N' [Sutterella sp.]